MIKSVLNYIDVTIDVKVNNGKFVKSIEPEFASVKYSKLVVNPIFTLNVRRIDEEHYSIHVQVSGFTSDALFSLIRAEIGSKVGGSLIPYEKMLIDNKPMIALIGFKITDVQGEIHDIRLDDPKLLPYLFNPGPLDGTIIDVLSPVHMLITDSQGRRVGVLFNSNISEVNEIPGAFYTGPLKEGEFVYLPSSVKYYKIKIFGIESGNYTLRVVNIRNGTSEVKTYTGEVKAKDFQEFEVTESGIKLISSIPWYLQYWYIVAIVLAFMLLLLLLLSSKIKIK